MSKLYVWTVAGLREDLEGAWACTTGIKWRGLQVWQIVHLVGHCSPSINCDHQSMCKCMQCFVFMRTAVCVSVRV